MHGKGSARGTKGGETVMSCVEMQAGNAFLLPLALFPSLGDLGFFYYLVS
jgi:hypothetical protein